MTSRLDEQGVRKHLQDYIKTMIEDIGPEFYDYNGFTKEGFFSEEILLDVLIYSEEDTFYPHIRDITEAEKQFIIQLFREELEKVFDLQCLFCREPFVSLDAAAKVCQFCAFAKKPETITQLREVNYRKVEYEDCEHCLFAQNIDKWGDSAYCEELKFETELDFVCNKFTSKREIIELEAERKMLKASN